LHTPTKRGRQKREADSFDDRIWQWSLTRVTIIAIGIVIAMCGLIVGPRGSIAGLMKAAKTVVRHADGTVMRVNSLLSA
jgi:hypothetical protein